MALRSAWATSLTPPPFAFISWLMPEKPPKAASGSLQSKCQNLRACCPLILALGFYCFSLSLWNPSKCKITLADVADERWAKNPFSFLPLRGEVYVPTAWDLTKENMAETMPHQFLGPGLKKLGASSSHLSNTCFWNQLPCCEEAQEA